MKLLVIVGIALASISSAVQAQSRIFMSPTAVGTGATRAVKIQECATGANCKIIVKVTAHAIHGKRCLADVDSAAIVVVRGAVARDIEWELDAPAGVFRFDPTLGIDVLGDDDLANREFNNGTAGTAMGKSTYTVRHHKRVLHRDMAYNYNVTVQKNDGVGNWSQCGFIDPIIINRP